MHVAVPATAKVPAPQAWHTDEVVASTMAEAWPAAQLMQLALPVLGWYDPTHDVQLALPAAAALPATQEAHVEALSFPDEPEYVPAAHSMQRAAPSGALVYVPAGQAAHELAPADEYIPMAQTAHVDESAALFSAENVPAVQLTQLSEPPSSVLVGLSP